MEKLEIIINEKLPHIRYLSLDAHVYLTFNAKLQELEVYVTTTRTTASVQVKQTVVVSDLIHSARISDEGHVFPILKTNSCNVYISFDELKGYLTACELCGIEPDSEVCENAQVHQMTALE